MVNDTVSFGGNRILTFYKDAKRLRAGKAVIPRMISCWLTHICNLNCSYCLYTDSHNEKYKDVVDTEKFLKFIDEIARLGVEGIEFGGGGEPTIHKDCFTIAKYAKERGLQVGMLTNAARFDVPLACESFRYIRLGIDAHTDELYQQVKGTRPGVFAKTEANCRELIGYRNAMTDSKFPRIGVKHLIGRKNVGFLLELVEWARSIGADYVHFKAEHNSPDSLTAEERIYYGQFLDVIKKEYPDFIKGDLNFLQGKFHCFMSPIHAVLDAHGNLNQCCYFTEERDQIGNVFKQGFEGVWFSERHHQVMAAKTVEGCNKFDCRWHLYNTQAVEMLEGESQDLSFI